MKPLRRRAGGQEQAMGVASRRQIVPPRRWNVRGRGTEGNTALRRVGNLLPVRSPTASQ